MKKILILFFLIFCSITLKAQLNGNGSYGLPYNGTFEGDLQWTYANFSSGKIYLNGDVTIDDELLSVEAGTSIIFLAEGADLIITGTGSINASGADGNNIFFTADDDNDGNYGEAGERWGRIVFLNSTGTSVLNYCDISFGSNIGSGFAGYGGGIYISTNYLTLSNSVIHNNTATFGGGIYVNDYSGQTINNCRIYSNSATASGGGLYLSYNSFSTVTNCIISNNVCTNTGDIWGGGGLGIYTSNGNTRLINCTIANNNHQTPYSKRGNDILIKSSNPSFRFVNSIVWGSNDYSVFIESTPISTNFINSAIRRVYNASGEIQISSYTNCFNLNSSNTASNGPNFNAIDGSDWSINFISPCRDAGTTPSPTVPNDFIGNSRIGPYDIGAYEVQYSRWAGTTSDQWSTASNWEESVDPSTGTGDVIVPSGLSTYPVSSSNPGFTIGSGKQMIIEPGARVTLDDLTNNGTLKMNANASGLSSLVMSSYTRGTGASEDIQIYLTGGGPPNRWHYISAPIASYPVGTFTANTLDLATWVDGIQGAGTLREGWVAYDGYEYLFDDPLANPVTWAGYPYRFSTLTLGKGYNFWDDLASYTYSLSGQLNTGSVNVTLDFAGADYENGFNLLGNPFTSGLDWDYVVENTAYPENTSHGIYFTKDDVQYSYNSGVQVPEGEEPAPSGVIPPMQGFFVKTYQDNVVINLTSDARTHDNIAPRYKGSSIIPLVRLAITDNGTSDETVVRFAETAKTGNDMEFDALKMFTSSDKTAIYTTYPGMKYSINGQPFPETLVEIPVSVNVTSAGNHTINAKQLQGLDNYNVKLKDNLTGFTADLKSIPELSFSANAGLINDRFVLIVENVLIGSEDPVASENMFNIYSGNGYINIQTLSDDWDGKQGSATVYDLSGKTFTDSGKTEFSKNSITQIAAPVSNGLYVVELRSGAKRYMGKVVIR